MTHNVFQEKDFEIRELKSNHVLTDMICAEIESDIIKNTLVQLFENFIKDKNKDHLRNEDIFQVNKHILDIIEKMGLDDLLHLV